VIKDQSTTLDDTSNYISDLTIGLGVLDAPMVGLVCPAAATKRRFCRGLGSSGTKRAKSVAGGGTTSCSR
jgi:hypothetical protein